MTETRPSNFIRDIIDGDLASGKHSGVVTRFPPEPNGYLHIGHAKSIALNFGLARDYEGRCHLRMDDTNPTKEEIEYVESIQADIRWLGFDWGTSFFHASDYFGQLYAIAEHLVERGKAYVCHQTLEELRADRGSLSDPGTNSPYRMRTVDENLQLLRQMKAGEFTDGACTLRAKIDMAHPNLKMRDPAMYRIRRAHHFRQGDDWCIYPLYDFAHGLSDAIEGITHSICTLEFENNRPLYDWYIDEARGWLEANAGMTEQPRQYEFARLFLSHTVMSKRKLLRLVEDGHVSGWDDPRMPTIAAFRRRGFTPQAIASFCEMIGVAKNNSLVDLEKLEWAIRDDLNRKVPRLLAVVDPIKVVIDNYPRGEVESLTAPLYPHDVPLEGSRSLPFGRELYIERADFMETPGKGFRRLSPGVEVRLRHAYFIRCESVVKDESGQVVELRCTYDPATRGGKSADGRKVKGTIHWVSASGGLACEIRLYDRLFTVAQPGTGDADFLDEMNPDSLTVMNGVVEPFVKGAPAGTAYQFERQGYFCVDLDTTADRLVFNRTVTLKDSWQKAAPEPQKGKSKPKQAQPQATTHRVDKDLLEDATLAAFHQAAVGAGATVKGALKWMNNELLRLLKDQEATDLAFNGADLGALVALVEKGTISARAGKDVFDAMSAGEGRPADIVKARGLTQVSDSGALEALADEILAAHADEVARIRDGAKNLLGFFVGQLMKKSRGSANPQLARELLLSKLG